MRNVLTDFFCAILTFWVCIFQLLTVLDLAKNLVGFIAKYAVDVNLFRLGSSTLKHGGLGAQPRWGVWVAQPPTKFFLFNILLRNAKQNRWIFFFKSAQIYMRDAECSETNEKSYFSNFYFPSYRHFCIQEVWE